MSSSSPKRAKVRIGDTFGRLTVISGPDIKGRRRRYWHCKCECGAESLVLQDNLRGGKTKSCGCLGRENSSLRGKSRNGENNPNWVGGRVHDHKGYIRIYWPNHPSANSNGYIQEHRAIAEKVLGRGLKQNETVHHIDERKDNNAHNNLVICDRGLHQTIHKRMRRMKHE